MPASSHDLSLCFLPALVLTTPRLIVEQFPALDRIPYTLTYTGSLYSSTVNMYSPEMLLDDSDVTGLMLNYGLSNVIADLGTSQRVDSLYFAYLNKSPASSYWNNYIIAGSNDKITWTNIWTPPSISRNTNPYMSSMTRLNLDGVPNFRYYKFQASANMYLGISALIFVSSNEHSSTFPVTTLSATGLSDGMSLPGYVLSSNNFANNTVDADLLDSSHLTGAIVLSTTSPYIRADLGSNPGCAPSRSTNCYFDVASVVFSQLEQPGTRSLNGLVVQGSKDGNTWQTIYVLTGILGQAVWSVFVGQQFRFIQITTAAGAADRPIELGTFSTSFLFLLAFAIYYLVLLYFMHSDRFCSFLPVSF